MPDLLRVLARRSLTPPGVRPRTLSRFESEAAQLVPSAHSDEDHHEAPATELRQPLQRRARTESQTTVAPSAEATLALPSVTRASEAPPSSSPPLVATIVDSPTTPRQSRSDASVATTAPALEPVAASLSTIARDPVPVTLAMLPVAPLADTRAERPVHESQVRERVEPRTEPLLVVPTLSSPPRQAPAVVEPSSRRADMYAEPAAPSRVEIHIGRIEVRAQPAPSIAAEKPSAAAPKPASLEDLLARRRVSR